MDKDEPFIKHIEALRSALIKCFCAYFLVLIPSLYVSPFLLSGLEDILIGKNDIVLNYFSPAEVFVLQIKLGALLALVISFPYILKKIWDFVLPALYERERKLIGKIVVLSSLLFIIGLLFCLFVVIPLIINFGMSFADDNTKALFGVTNVINLALHLSLIFGLIFQTPLIVRFLIKSDIISYETISDKRPYIVVALLTLAALLTPPDIVSQILLFIPTYLLFELGLLFSKK